MYFTVEQKGQASLPKLYWEEELKTKWQMFSLPNHSQK